MFFRITGNANAEVCFAAIANIFIYVYAMIQAHDLLHQVNGITMAIGL